jgi:hypothetical protein
LVQVAQVPQVQPALVGQVAQILVLLEEQPLQQLVVVMAHTLEILGGQGVLVVAVGVLPLVVLVHRGKDLLEALEPRVLTKERAAGALEALEKML